MLPSPAIEDVTLLICTKDRPDFLFRALDFYCSEGTFAGNVLVSDASTDENWRRIEQRYAKGPTGQVGARHAAPGQTIPQRIRECLQDTCSEFVFLVADDDILFVDWLQQGVDLLRRDRECAVVFGHTLSFAIGDFSPRGDLEDLRITSPNPPLHWLADQRLEDRLQQLTGREWTTEGWYALQRVRDLKLITDTAIRFGLDGYVYERFLIFAQAVVGTTVMLDNVFLARQLNRNQNRTPYSYREEKPQLQALEDASVHLLRATRGLDAVRALELVRTTYAEELRRLKVNDRRRPLRKLKEYLPRLAKAYSPLSAQSSESVGYGDSRFPVKPSLPALQDKIVTLSGIAREVQGAGAGR